MTILAAVTSLVGLFFAAVGAWSAATGSRPSWFPGRALPAGKARTWGGATALGGAGLTIWGADELFLGNSVVAIVGVVLVLAGAIWISAATPSARRSK